MAQRPQSGESFDLFLLCGLCAISAPLRLIRASAPMSMERSALFESDACLPTASAPFCGSRKAYAASTSSVRSMGETPGTNRRGTSLPVAGSASTMTVLPLPSGKPAVDG